MKFFIDNNLSELMARGMTGFGEDVVHLKHIFPPNTQDTEWLKYIGDNGMFLITRDLRVTRNPLELEQVLKNNVGAFFLGGKNLTGWELLVRWLNTRNILSAALLNEKAV